MKKIGYLCGKCGGKIPDLPREWTGHLVLYCPCGQSFVDFGRYKDCKKTGVIGYGGFIKIARNK